jgi:uncharacterized repeat protein (TIGR03803 family)
MTNPGQQLSWISPVGLQATNIALVLAVLLSALVMCPSAQAQFKVLYSFKGAPDGDTPLGRLLTFSKPDYTFLVGTTSTGGTDGQGAIFRLYFFDGVWTYTVLHSFDHTKSEGSSPVGSLVRDSAGNLYGTTSAGGDANCSCGTVFKLDTHDVLTVLHRFTGKPDGAYPYAGLVLDKKGNLYGTTQHGGLPCKFNFGQECGVVFKVDASGKETVLHHFTGGWDGGVPGYGALVRDDVGVLYGSTSLGGQLDFAGVGAVFELHRNGTLKVLYSFTGGDGSQPLGGVLLLGNTLYGSTSQGGSGGWGTVFDLDTLTGKETVLYNFTDHADGGYPQSDLVADDTGQQFWGSTYGGGIFTDCPGSGCGTVFSVPVSGGKKVLHKFSNSDGAFPWSGPIRIIKTLYGTASRGGDFGVGVVYKIHVK